MSKLFIVEDDLTLRGEMIKLLHTHKHECHFTDDFENAVDHALKSEPDLLILDVNLPFFDGYHICRAIREQSGVPIIILTSRNTEMDELMGMHLGADDFITKPFNPQILLARIASLLKRSKGTGHVEIIKVGELLLDLSTATVKVKGSSSELTKNEQRILHLLMKNPGKIVSREEIMHALWQSEAFVDDNTLTVNMNRLRKKLDDLGLKEIIQTKRGLGYLLCE